MLTLFAMSAKTKTIKGELFKDGFKIRAWRCPQCNKVLLLHPLDMAVRGIQKTEAKGL